MHLTQHMKFPQAFKCFFLDSVDLVFMEAKLNDVGRQVCRDLSQQVVGEVQQSEMIHVSEGLGVNLGDLVVDQKQALFWGKRSQNETQQSVKLMLLSHMHWKLKVSEVLQTLTG